MSTKTEVENIKTSGSEKVLAGVLAIFILIGGVWTYSQIGKVSEDTYRDDYGGMMFPSAADLSPEDQAALKAGNRASNDLWQANRQVQKAKNQIEFTGDAYRTEIDAGLAGTNELAAYREAQRQLANAQAEVREARAAVAETKPAAREARANQRSAWQSAENDRQSEDRWVAILRVLLIAGMLVASTAALSVCRRRRSRLLPLALAGIIASALLAAYMALDYGTSLGVFREMGPLLISLIGMALTVTAFILLQRYLARKIPARRVRRKECPFCGYPGHDNQHCEGCGRTIIGECSTCHQERRISTPHCGNCGAA